MNQQPAIEELEKIIVGEPGALSFPNNKERINAVYELEKYGLQGLGVIGTYWMLQGHFDIKEASSEIEEVLNNVSNTIRNKYTQIKTNEEFIRKVAEEIIGYVPEDDKVLSENTYQKIYSTVHAVIFPAMLMGRIDSFGEGKECTLKRILTGTQKLGNIVETKKPEEVE